MMLGTTATTRLMDLNKLAEWIEAELGQRWPEATLDQHRDQDGNHDFRIRTDGEFFFLKLGHRVVLNSTNEEVVALLVQRDWIPRLQDEVCLFVAMRKNAPVLRPCPN